MPLIYNSITVPVLLCFCQAIILKYLQLDRVLQQVLEGRWDRVGPAEAKEHIKTWIPRKNGSDVKSQEVNWIINNVFTSSGTTYMLSFVPLASFLAGLSELSLWSEDGYTLPKVIHKWQEDYKSDNYVELSSKKSNRYIHNNLHSLYNIFYLEICLWIF